MTKVTIGGTEYEVPVMMYKQLKAIWPRMRTTFSKIQKARTEAAAEEVDGVSGMFDALDDAIFVVGTALTRDDPAHTPEWVENNMTPLEAQALPNVVMSMMQETGLIKTGERPPAGIDALLARQQTTTATGSANTSPS